MQNVQEELKATKQRRTTVKAQCTRFQTYTMDTVDIQSVSVIELQRFNPIWNEFNGIQGKIEALDNSDHDGMNPREEERSSFESKYFAIVTKLETLIEHRQRIEQPIHTLQNLHQSRESTPIMQGTISVNDSLKLPRITLPTFAGKYDEWAAFHNMFHSMIHQNASLPNVQKMQYLVSALKNEAYDVISSLEPSCRKLQGSLANAHREV